MHANLGTRSKGEVALFKFQPMTPTRAVWNPTGTYLTMNGRMNYYSCLVRIVSVTVLTVPFIATLESRRRKSTRERERERWKVEKIDGRRSRRATGIFRDPSIDFSSLLSQSIRR